MLAFRQPPQLKCRAANQCDHTRKNCREAQSTVPLVGCSRAAESPSEPMIHDVANRRGMCGVRFASGGSIPQPCMSRRELVPPRTGGRQCAARCRAPVHRSSVALAGWCKKWRRRTACATFRQPRFRVVPHGQTIAVDSIHRGLSGHYPLRVPQRWPLNRDRRDRYGGRQHRYRR
jgi:hypothetical protein